MTGIANTLRKIGNIYRDQKYYAKALDNYFKALKIFEQTKDKLGIGRCYSNIGEIYDYQNKKTESLEYLLKALKMHEEADYKNGLVITYLRMGRIYTAGRNYSAGLDYSLKALDIALKNYDRNVIAKEQVQEAYGGVGESYLEKAKSRSIENTGNADDSDLKKAVTYLSTAIVLAREMGELTDVRLYYKNLSEAEALLGSHLQAYTDLSLSYLLQDSLFSAANNHKIINIETQRERELKETISQLERVKKRNEMLVIIACFAVLVIIMGIIFRNNKLLSAEKKKSDDLLLNIIPSEVAQELKDKGSTKAKHYDNVSVLFTDFVNFTTASERMSPQELIDELHACFKGFDEITAKYNIEKIKTIGDAYMAVGGLPAPDSKHAENVVKAAIEISAFMQDRIVKLGERTFRIRIGVHSGSVVAGIVGVRKFAYDIWGDTVNTAARMEQNSEAGRINISEITYELVKDKFSCEYRGEIEAKNKGKMKMYFVS